jgi:transcription elongation factor Elf1
MFLFGGKKNEPKKIEADFEERLKAVVRAKLCPLCGKMQSSKAAFGEGVQPSLTCNNCELKAVNNITQKLGPKNLITTEKLASLLTAELISYQKGQTETPLSQKENSSLGQTLDKKAKEISTFIKNEMHCLKEISKAKVEELTLEAEKQNAMPIFEETLKLQAEKKSWSPDFLGETIRRSLVGSKGVHFIDQQEL